MILNVIFYVLQITKSINAHNYLTPITHFGYFKSFNISVHLTCFTGFLSEAECFIFIITPPSYLIHLLHNKKVPYFTNSSFISCLISLCN